MQLSSPVLRMTKPSAMVPPPRQTVFGEQANAMYELENSIVHKTVTERFNDREMPVGLISAIGGFLRAFSDPEDHALFLELANHPEQHDTGHYKIRNLINLSPMTDSGVPVDAFEMEGLKQTLYLLNGLSVWGINTSRSVIEGKQAEQAKALLYAATCVEYRVLAYPLSEHYISSRLRRSRFLTDPEFADLLMEFPEHHRLITDTVIDRNVIDAEMLRQVVTGSALAISEGTL
jgi:hypothetical protein